jgi:hypothetical protein
MRADTRNIDLIDPVPVSTLGLAPRFQMPPHDAAPDAQRAMMDFLAPSACLPSVQAQSFGLTDISG